MPIYEYVCTSCDHRADILQGINDPDPKYCPSCGKEGTMRKQFAPPTIHYKGSGWAKKDRGSSSSGTKAASSRPSEAKHDSSSGESGSSSEGGGSSSSAKADQKD